MDVVKSAVAKFAERDPRITGMGADYVLYPLVKVAVGVEPESVAEASQALHAGSGFFEEDPFFGLGNLVVGLADFGEVQIIHDAPDLFGGKFEADEAGHYGAGRGSGCALDLTEQSRFLQSKHGSGVEYDQDSTAFKHEVLLYKFRVHQFYYGA